MIQLMEPRTFTVPLSFEAHSLAKRMRCQQSDPHKAKQVYLNTLAVYAVEFYLRCLGIETGAAQSNSHNPTYLKFMDVADLWVKDLGKLECRPVLPDSTVLQTPADVASDRIGYIAVGMRKSLKQAVLYIKCYKSVAAVYRNRVPDFDDQLMLVAAGLWNLSLDVA